MNRFLRPTLLIAAVAAAALVHAATTTVSARHPLLSAEAGATSVYFIRPDAGFRGVMGKPVSIRLDGEELLKLAKGEYTLVRLKPWSGDVVVRSSTVVMMGGMNSMTKVEESRPFAFAAGETYCIMVAETLGSPGAGSTFTPELIGCEQAVTAVAELTAIGDATGAPLTR